MNKSSVNLSIILKEVDTAFIMGNYDQAIEILVKGYSEAEENKQIKEQLILLSELGGIYRNAGKKNEAKAVIEKIEVLLPKADLDDISLATILLNCATNLKYTGENQKAVDYYLLALDKYLNNDFYDMRVWGSLYNNLGLAYRDIGNYESALECYNNALFFAKEWHGGENFVPLTYLNIADVYLDKGEFLEVNKYLDSAFSCFENGQMFKCKDYFDACRKAEKSFSLFGQESRAKFIKNLINSNL